MSNSQEGQEDHCSPRLTLQGALDARWNFVAICGVKRRNGRFQKTPTGGRMTTRLFASIIVSAVVLSPQFVPLKN
jgi:hypothetical protein